MNFKTLLISLSLHAVVGYSMSLSGALAPGPSERSIKIEYIKREQPSIPSKPAPPAQIYKKPKPIPTPATKTEIKAMQEKTAEAKRKDELRKRVAEEIRQFSKKPPAKPMKKTATAMDFMADPVAGKFFMSYFATVKGKIEQQIKREYSDADDRMGVVSLMFVLRTDGSLKVVQVDHSKSNADNHLRMIALQALKNAAPFSQFPQSLDSEEIAFSLKIYFDEL